MKGDGKMRNKMYQSGENQSGENLMYKLKKYASRIGATAIITLAPILPGCATTSNNVNNPTKVVNPNPVGKYLDNSFNNYVSLDYYLFDREGKDPVYGITHKPGNFVHNWLDLGYTIIVGLPSESMKRAEAEKAAEGKTGEKGPVVFVFDTARFLKQAAGVAGEAVWNTPGAIVNGLRERPLDLIVDGAGGYFIGDILFGGGDGNGKAAGEARPPPAPFPQPIPILPPGVPY